MSSTAIQEATSTVIFRNVVEAFGLIGFSIKEEDIAIDFARFNSQGLESTFSVSTIENVQRKPFNEAVVSLKTNKPGVEEFKVKYKRPEKNVRFYLKINNQSRLDESTLS